MMGNVVLFLIRSGIIDLGAFCVEHFSSAKEFRSQCHIFRFESRLVGKSPSAFVVKATVKVKAVDCIRRELFCRGDFV